MTGITASAPGKVVLSGEYAVLYGAPAVCMAVDRRAIVRVAHVDATWNSIVAPGYSSVEGRFLADGPTPVWLQGEDEFTLVDAAWRVLKPRDVMGVLIELHTATFFDDTCDAKVGLGSSAALTVALTAALTQSGDVLDKAMQVHRLFQSGAGSGVDVAASVQGGLFEYRMRGATTAALRWPEGLVYRLVWTGAPANTPEKLVRLTEAGHRRSRDALVDAAASTALAWRTASEVLGQLPGYIEALRDFSEDYDLGIFDAGHDKLLAAATAAGLVYKPCGAGGGDVGILLGTNSEQLDEFLARKPVPGCHVLESKLEIQGVSWERH